MYLSTTNTPSLNNMLAQACWTTKRVVLANFGLSKSDYKLYSFEKSSVEKCKPATCINNKHVPLHSKAVFRKLCAAKLSFSTPF